MEISKQKSKKLSETDVEALIVTNRILKDHLDYLRAKLSKTEAILEMFINAVDKEDEKQDPISLNTISLN